MSAQDISPAHKEDVLRSLRRAALIYKHFAETLVAELGKEKAVPLVRKAVEAYGKQIGEESRGRAQAKGLELTPQNYQDDLPGVGWEMVPATVNGEAVTEVRVCPLADFWKDMDQDLARLYCYVDQAKMRAYNPDLEYVHLSNQLDGCKVCHLAVRKKK